MSDGYKSRFVLRALSITIVLATHCAAQTATPIPSSFFAMSAVQSNYPKVTIGLLAHQDFAWVTIERSRGKFNFQSYDNYMSDIQKHGLVDAATNTANTAMTLAAGTPGWAVADQSSCSTGANGFTACTAPPDNLQDWKDFLAALIQHYNGKTQPHIKYYELWNETNVTLWWTGTDAQMVTLAQAAYPIIHQDPYSILLTPSVAGPVGTVSPNSGVTWMTGYLQAGGSKYADGGAFHGYLAAQSGINPFPMPEEDSTPGCKQFVGCYGSIITKATQMRAAFDQNGLPGKPMFQTEGSWGHDTLTDPDTQVEWLARWNLLQAGLRSTLNLQMAAWFTWGGGTTFGWGDIEDASHNPTAAGLAYNQIFSWVVGSTIAQPCSGAANGTWTCLLVRPGGYAAQAVWNTQGSTSYSPGPGYSQYRDLAGNTTRVSTGASVTIGAKPILLESAGSATLPQINSGGIVIHAGVPAAVSPGSLVDIYGTNLAAAPVSASAGPQLPVSLGGVQVFVNNAAAPLIYVGPQQIIFQAPYETALGAASVTVVSNNSSSAPAPMFVQQAAPDILIYGNNRAVVVNQDGSVNAASNGAKPGTVLVAYLIGSGPLDNAIPTGSPAPLSPLSHESLATTVTVGGSDAAVQFSGMTPGFAGLVQVNFVMPNLSPGDYPIQVSIGGASSNQPILTVSK